MLGKIRKVKGHQYQSSSLEPLGSVRPTEKGEGRAFVTPGNVDRVAGGLRAQLDGLEGQRGQLE
jgi:hypothetical protein